MSAGSQSSEARTAPAVADGELVITRVLDAPRDLVWKAWTEPERLMHWWGPKGFVMQTVKLDLRPGGVFHYGMRSPGGAEMWGKFVYREIRAPERLVYVVSFADEAGNTLRHPASATWPLEVLNTLTLTEHAGRTTLMLHGVPINATATERATFSEAKRNVQAGTSAMLDQLEAYLATARAGEAK